MDIRLVGWLVSLRTAGNLLDKHGGERVEGQRATQIPRAFWHGECDVVDLRNRLFRENYEVYPDVAFPDSTNLSVGSRVSTQCTGSVKFAIALTFLVLWLSNRDTQSYSLNVSIMVFHNGL